MHYIFRIFTIPAAVVSASVASAQDSACVTLRDAVSHQPIATALVRIDAPGVGSRDVWSDSAGRACWLPATLSAVRGIEADALGYRHARRGSSANDTLELTLQRVGVAAGEGEGTAIGDDEWGTGQMTLAVALALRDVRRCIELANLSCASSQRASIASPSDLSALDSLASAAARDRLRRLALPFLETIQARLRTGTRAAPQVVREASVTTVSAFVDVPGSADHYTELRVAIPTSTGRALFGATETLCKGTECDRGRQVSMRWDMNDHRALAPILAMSTDGASGALDVFDLIRPASAPGSPVRAATRAVVVRGVVRDDKDGVVSGVQILASPGEGDTRTDSSGSFALVVHTDASAVILTARALGHTPVFRTVVVAGDTTLRWEPRLRAVQLLSARVVTGKGVPAQLSAWRYDELMKRRASGRGFFMVGNEISSSSSIGDALSRAPGVHVKMKYSNTIQGITMSHCTQQVIPGFIAPEALIGVWVNGIERTVAQAAESVLGDLLVAEVIAMEVYNGASAIPAEFTAANYCGVVAVWTK